MSNQFRRKLKRGLLLVLIAAAAAVSLPAQTPPQGGTNAAQQTASPGPTRANLLRGQYGRYRANNDLLSYHLDVRIDPEKKYLAGKNTIRFKMLKDDTRI